MKKKKYKKNRKIKITNSPYYSYPYKLTKLLLINNKFNYDKIKSFMRRDSWNHGVKKELLDINFIKKEDKTYKNNEKYYTISIINIFYNYILPLIQKDFIKFENDNKLSYKNLGCKLTNKINKVTKFYSNIKKYKGKLINDDNKISFNKLKRKKKLEIKDIERKYNPYLKGILFEEKFNLILEREKEEISDRFNKHDCFNIFIIDIFKDYLNSIQFDKLKNDKITFNDILRNFFYSIGEKYILSIPFFNKTLDYAFSKDESIKDEREFCEDIILFMILCNLYDVCFKYEVKQSEKIKPIKFNKDNYLISKANKTFDKIIKKPKNFESLFMKLRF